MTARRRAAGRILGGCAIPFVALGDAVKLALLQPARDTPAQLGWPTDDATIRGVGIAWGVAPGVWTGLYLREPRLRALIAGGETRS